MVAKGKYMAGNTEFQTFKKKVLKASAEEIDNQAEHAAVMWDFLIGFAALKAFYRSLIVQVFNKLMQVPSWVQAWEDHSELHAKVKTLHEDLQAALAMQHEVLMKSIAPAALRSMAAVREEARPEKVRQDMAKERMLDEIREEADDDATNAAFGNEQEPEAQHTSGPSGPLAALQEGIDAVLGIDSHSKLAFGGRDALQKLRIGCVSCAGQEEHLQRESQHAPEVLGFLLTYARDADAAGQVSEVMNQLMASPSWAAVLESSQPLKDGLRELPEEVQAALALQHEVLMHLVSAEARRRAKEGNLSDRVKGVAERMQSIRPPPAAARAGGVPAAAPAAAPLPPDEWRETKTPEGHSYYYNARTRQSLWERPACLGGPHVYKVGDAVEVWSNGMKAWGSGKVEKLEGDKVIAEFVLPGGGVARKELPAKHKDLRPLAVVKADEAWSSAEKAAYHQWYDAVPGPAEAKPGMAVAQFLSKSGLKRQALKQVWAVANPSCKPDMGFEEFARCCRLIAHIQALGDAPVVVEADRNLRVKLREECLIARPAELARFAA